MTEVSIEFTITATATGVPGLAMLSNWLQEKGAAFDILNFPVMTRAGQSFTFIVVARDARTAALIKGCPAHFGWIDDARPSH